MRKLWIALGIVGVLTLASCKKNWTCQCTDNNSNNTYHDIPNSTLNDANQTCNDFEYNMNGNYNNCSIIQ